MTDAAPKELNLPAEGFDISPIKAALEAGSKKLVDQAKTSIEGMQLTPLGDLKPLSVDGLQKDVAAVGVGQSLAGIAAPTLGELKLSSADQLKADIAAQQAKIDASARQAAADAAAQQAAAAEAAAQRKAAVQDQIGRLKMAQLEPLAELSAASLKNDVAAAQIKGLGLAPVGDMKLDTKILDSISGTAEAMKRLRKMREKSEAAKAAITNLQVKPVEPLPQLSAEGLSREVTKTRIKNLKPDLATKVEPISAEAVKDLNEKIIQAEGRKRLSQNLASSSPNAPKEFKPQPPPGVPPLLTGRPPASTPRAREAFAEIQKQRDALNPQIQSVFQEPIEEPIEEQNETKSEMWAEKRNLPPKTPTTPASSANLQQLEDIIATDWVAAEEKKSSSRPTSAQEKTNQKPDFVKTANPVEDRMKQLDKQATNRRPLNVPQLNPVPLQTGSEEQIPTPYNMQAYNREKMIELYNNVKNDPAKLNEFIEAAKKTINLEKRVPRPDKYCFLPELYEIFDTDSELKNAVGVKSTLASEKCKDGKRKNKKTRFTKY